ncbi:Calcium-binding ef hand family protein [Thalictrum thalictroides]|uniref:Calcium-binding ef hand family protein n=1 Tax=Thalictrum thalictroides TaxID=46969 RepID=A0A7J6XFG9_THATH|nr:Calcium-binding ef hand family protein [Thalictrum thalictroides]
MAAQNPASNTDLFDLYFRRADLNQDGKISGAEAVSFFQGANLPKHVLAQIWDRADQNRAGFLSRAEFYNALKLITVAQSKRELTPDIVKAALFGPAAAKIPAPQINLAATPAPQANSLAAPPVSLMAAAGPTAHNAAFRGPQVPPNTSTSQQYFPPQGNQFLRPPQSMAGGVGSVPTQSVAGQGLSRGSIMGAARPSSPNVSTDWLGARAPGVSNSQVPIRGVTPSMPLDGFALGSSGTTSSLPPRPQSTPGITPSVAPKPQDQSLPSSQATPKDSKALAISGNGFASDSIFGGDVFSAISNQPKQETSAPSFSANSLPASSAIVPVTTTPQTSSSQSSLDSLQSTFSMHPSGGQVQRSQPQVKQNQQMPTQSTSRFASGILPGAVNTSSQSQPAWPRMTQADIQKYTKTFVAVDTDRDGKITGEQARNLFLSWKLPREVLKQVWDLSDQDNDSMLSLREFCTALYLMERFREGHPLPAALPSNIMFDETLLPTTRQPADAYGNAAWGPTPGMQQHHGMPGVQRMTPTAGGRPPIQALAPQADGTQPTQQKPRVPVLEKHLVNQLSNDEQSSLNSKFQEATEADKKVQELEKEILDSKEKIEFYRTKMQELVQELEKEILDSKEKIEFYRTKMQELVLYKSRCDNRLNEITERAIADKREAESLAKKYDEKYKQVGDIASKLTIEEATFRDIQERKMELYNAIVKIEQGGSADGILQVRADRIQSDLEELVKALNERCKKYGLKMKPTVLVELPFGWQPGVQEGAADWDEDWDKFEDEGFTFVKELTVDVQNVIAPPKDKSKPVRKEKASADEDVSSSIAKDKEEKPYNTSEQVHEGGSTYTHSEDESARSAPGSPAGRSTLESPSNDFRDNHFAKSVDSDALFHTKENRSDDHGAAESTISGEKSFDEPTWGTFDTNDDTESVWGFNPMSTKETDRDSFFGSNDFGLDPIRTHSPQADSFYGKKTPFNFADSVPGTPLFNSNSPRRFSEGSEEHSFDNFSRFDSFNTTDSGFFPQRETLTRFDSIRSTNSEFGHAFPSFDDVDPFGSSGPFKTSSENQTPRRGSDSWSAF